MGGSPRPLCCDTGNFEEYKMKEMMLSVKRAETAQNYTQAQKQGKVDKTIPVKRKRDKEQFRAVLDDVILKGCEKHG